MVSSEKRVSLFGNNPDLKDASFSSYMNDNTTVLKLTHPAQTNTKKIEDGEIGVFGAEKYFKGAMDEKLPRTPNPVITHPKTPQEKYEEEPPKPKTESVRSESSWNSRTALLVNGSQRTHRARREKTGTVKSLLASLGCNCNDTSSVKIAEKRVQVKEVAKPTAKTEPKREDCFTFPVLTSRPAMKIKAEESEEEEVEITHVKTRKNSLEVFGSPVLEHGKKSFSLERKLTMLNWDGVTPKAENIDIPKSGGSNDAGSDASSDLFEIESFSTNGNNSFLARQVSNGRSSNATLPNGYAPSEASIAWSVVTASVADFSILSDFEDPRTPKPRTFRTSADMDRVIRGTGILSGCTSHKSVRVAGDKAVVKDRFRMDSMMPIVKFQAETKPMRERSPGASRHLYIQQ